MKRSSIVAAVSIFAVIAGVAGALYYRNYKLHSAPPPPAFEPPTAVDAVAARTHPWQQTADLTGTVIALRSVTISNEVSGTISSLAFKSGSIVEKDAVLLTLDDATDRADLAAAESLVRVAQANVSVADARLRLAQTEVDRLSGAAASGAAPVADLDRAKAEQEKAVADRDRWLADVDQAKANVTQVKTRQAKKTIRAPFRGRVGLKNIHEGQYLAEGASVVSLQEVSDKIYLDFAIPQEHMSKVVPGTIVTASSSATGEKPLKLEVVAIDAQVNNETRNVRVRSIVDNADDRLREGMAVSIRVPIGPTMPLVVIPSTAVRRASFGDQVFVLVPAEQQGMFRAKQRFVKLGPTLGTDVVVTEGLKADEEVAAAGSFKLRDGALVMKAPPGGAGAPPAAAADHK